MDKMILYAILAMAIVIICVNCLAWYILSTKSVSQEPYTLKPLNITKTLPL